MKLHAVSSYLVSFDVQTAQPATENDFSPSPDTAGEPVHEDPHPAPEADIESLKRQYELDLAEALEKQHEMHLKALEDARDGWAVQVADDIARKISEAIESCFGALRADLVRALIPFISREVTELAVSDLIGSLELLLEDDESPSLRMEGPKDILHRVARSLAQRRPLNMELAEKDAVDMRLDLGATRLESRIDNWIGGLMQERGGAR